MGRLKEKFNEFKRKVKEKSQKIWHDLTQVAHEIKEECQQTVTRVKEKVDEWREKIKEYNEKVKEKRKRKRYKKNVLNEQVATLQLETKDEKILNNCKTLLNDTFGVKGIVDTLMNKNESERVDFMNNFCNRVADVFEVENLDIKVGYPENIYDQRVYGYYFDKERRLYINAAFVTCNDSSLVSEQVFTVFHEINHALQCATMREPEKYGYSKQRAYEIARNRRYYIRPEECDEGYRKQPIEEQSFRFEEILKNYCREHHLL